MEANYYENELSKINFHCLYCPKVKMSDENGETKWMNINRESATSIIKKLRKEFNIK